MDERRKAVRAKKPIEVTYTADSPPIEARLEDISENGFFLDTGHPLAEDAIIEFKFFLPDETPDKPIEGRGKVVWIEPMVGAGVEFQGLSQEDQERIRFFVASVIFTEKEEG